MDGLIQKQARFDVQNLEKYAERSFTKEETDEIYTSVLRAKRYCFIESGVTHPSFLDLFAAVTTSEQQQRVQKNLSTLLQGP